MLAARRGMIDRVQSDLRQPLTITRGPAAAQVAQQAQLPGVQAAWSWDPAERVALRMQQADDGFRRGEWAGSFGATTIHPADMPSGSVTQEAAEGLLLPRKEEVLGVISYPRFERGVRRHELMHGYTEAARAGYEGLPAWPQAVGSMPRWLGRPLDELGAQRAGGTPFMETPWGWYASYYAQSGDQGAARVARALEAAQRARRMGGRAAEFAADHPVLLGAGVGTAYLLNQALAEEEGE